MEDIKERIENEDKKPRKKFIIMIIVAGIIGGFAGLGIAFLEDYIVGEKSFLEMFAAFQRSLHFPAAVLMAVCGIVLWILCEISYRKARKMWADAKDQDEIYEDVDKTLSTAMIYTSIMNILSFVLFGIANYVMPQNKEPGWFIFGNIAIYLLFVFVVFFLQHKIVNFIKEMNPEKKGSLYDTKFKDKWYDSCDEAEKIQIGRAAYKAYIATSYLCLGLVAGLSLVGMVFEIGLLPIILVSAIWLTQTITFSMAEKNGGNTIIR